MLSRLPDNSIAISHHGHNEAGKSELKAMMFLVLRDGTDYLQCVPFSRNCHRRSRGERREDVLGLLREAREVPVRREMRLR